MGKPVSGIRDTFFRDLSVDYKGTYTDRREDTFLYRAFLAEGVKGLLKEHFPWCPVEVPFPWPSAEDLTSAEESPPLEDEIRAWLREAMGERPKWARGLLLREPPGKGRKERRDFWQELWLNDAGYGAGLISDTEYYLWLVDYLAARDIYYKDGSMEDGHAWLHDLLLAGLRGTERALEPRRPWTGERYPRAKAEVGRDLAELARLLRAERETGGAEIAGRLRNLKTSEGQAMGDYLPWLTEKLARMALHIKIKTWLQDSGYPLREDEDEDEAKQPPREDKDGAKEPRKRDFSMRLFEEYCDSHYEFYNTDDGVIASVEGWSMDRSGFCVLALDADQLEPFRRALEQSMERRKSTDFYMPLAVHLHSGCVFFLAGKDIYEEVYTRAAERSPEGYETYKAYMAATERTCFDYSRLDGACFKVPAKAAGGRFRLWPTFHKNMGRSYEDVLAEFKWYCRDSKHSTLQAVRALNLEGPAGTPEALHWAFDWVEEEAE